MAESTYRPGLEGVVAADTAISTIEGGLLYRGYPVENLADHASFEEVAWLLLEGERPSARELAEFRELIQESMQAVGDDVLGPLREIGRSCHPMDLVRSGVSLLSASEPEAEDVTPEADLRKAKRLIGQVARIVGAVGCWHTACQDAPPTPGQSLAASLLEMITGEPPDPMAERAMDISLILYAEHELNASTFAARVVASTLSDLHSAVVAAIATLKGPLHGGANERVMDVLEEVGHEQRAESWIREQLAAKRRIMGFGHRVYRDGDPRAVYLKPWCAKLAEDLGLEELERRADIIEQVVATEKRLPPNLDWPSARLYHYLDLPVPSYTPLFVASRVVGWSAHVIEQHGNNRLIRPTATYSGAPRRSWGE